MTETQAHAFADDWIAAWNSHDLDAIMGHYAPEVVLTSPVAARLLDNPTVSGKQALLAYFTRGLEAYPDLNFRLLEVMWGVSSIVLHYLNHSNTKCAEFMELASDGKIVRVIAHYGS
jgi:predicted ester cyclase